MSISALLEGVSQGFKMDGVVIGVVTNNKDPEGLGRVKVKFPWMSEQDESDWARVVTFLGGKEKGGAFFLPEVDDEVLAAFEHGDINGRLYVLGVLWNGKDKPPEANKDGKNNVKMIKTRTGLTIKLDDKAGEESIAIQDKEGKNKILISMKDKKIQIQAEKDIEISAKGKLKIEAKELEINTKGAAKLDINGNLDAKSSGNINMKGSTINLN